MSSVTASLRGGAVLPSDKKDLLSKLVAQDDHDNPEGMATCPAVQFQKCHCDDRHGHLGVLVECTAGTGCNYVNQQHLGNVEGATEEGWYCTQGALEENELVEESTELQDNPRQCAVLGSDSGGCVPNGLVGLYCKSGYTCVGYEAPSGGLQNPTLGACESDATRAVDTRSDAVKCHDDFYAIQIPCTNNGACHGNWVNPNGCEARCSDTSFTCVPPTFEEEGEELAASVDDTSADDTSSDHLHLPLDAEHCLVTTETERPGCSLDSSGDQIPTNGAVCCTRTVESDGTTTYSHSGVTCNYIGNHRNAVANSDAGPGYRCVLNHGEDLAVN